METSSKAFQQTTIWNAEKAGAALYVKECIRMNLQDIQRLWPIAKLLHESRRDTAWGPIAGPRREPFPEYNSSYTHQPIAYVDLALAQAKALDDAGLISGGEK